MEDEDQAIKIKFRIEGLDEDQGSVRLPVFREKLDQLTKILADAERQAARVTKAKSLLVVSDLSYSSAYTEIEPFVEHGYLGSVLGVELFESVITKLDEEADSLGDIQSSLVKKIQDICKGSGDKFKKQSINLGNKPISLNQGLADKAQKYLDRKYTSYGEVKGRIERINIHNRNDFYLYLDFNGDVVECHFKESELLDKVKSSLGKTVIARGVLTYIGSDVFPYVATINEIETIPEGYMTPSVDDLFGSVPDISGDKEVTDYIRNIRGEWELH